MPETNFSQVFTNSEELVETNPDFVYMVIPAKYVCTYHKLLVMLADVGIEMLNDCTANCKGNNKNVITIVSNIINISNILLSANSVFIMSCKFKFSILSKSLLNKKCRFTDV